MKYIAIILVGCFLPIFSQQNKSLTAQEIYKELREIKTISQPSGEFVFDNTIDYACILLQEIGNAYDDANYTIPYCKENYIVENSCLIDKNSRKLLPEVHHYIKNTECIKRVHGKYVLSLE